MNPKFSKTRLPIKFKSRRRDIPFNGLRDPLMKSELMATNNCADGPRGDYYEWCKLDKNWNLTFGEEEGNYAGGTLISHEVSGENYKSELRQKIIHVYENDPVFYTNIIRMLEHNKMNKWLDFIANMWKDIDNYEDEVKRKQDRVIYGLKVKNMPECNPEDRITIFTNFMIALATGPKTAYVLYKNVDITDYNTEHHNELDSVTITYPEDIEFRPGHLVLILNCPQKNAESAHDYIAPDMLNYFGISPEMFKLKYYKGYFEFEFNSRKEINK